jgi:RNA polymerase sigma-70 factor (ECF subfamily)
VTFCIGWIDETYAYIVADSAVTRSHWMPRDVRSSFGEMQNDCPMNRASGNGRLRDKDAAVQTHARMSFESFYKAHANAVYSYCLRRASAEEAKDATADVFVVAWRRWGAVPAGDAGVRWLYGVARNVLRDRRRSMARRGRLVEKVAAQPEAFVAGPELHVVRLVENEAVLAALAKLSERDREIIFLVEWEGLSRDQVAEIMSVTRSAIDKRMARAYKKLARSLRVDDQAPPPSPVPVDEGGEA